MHSFSIKRSKWVRGTYRSQVDDNRENDKFCAIGAYQCSLGIPAEEVSYTLRPKHAEQLVRKGAEWLVCPEDNGRGQVVGLNGSQAAATVISINDDGGDLHPLKEQQLIALFAKHNVTLTFED